MVENGRHRAAREIVHEVATLERRDEFDGLNSAKSDLDAAQVGLLFAESTSLSDADVERLWERHLDAHQTQIEELQNEVQRVVQARSRGPRLASQPEPATADPEEGTSSP
jgi:hypothetical protein